ncbi:helix-turn-helix transcriptional regulator [Fictibacillus aquaticus]|uniref:Transcriptional regulator n=1 Tax=Fictibacillus aquaticus TaxID=2021314 RepID=A0A235F6Z7_9BACL|nr:WYL domain-containing protein [Fictibacillus aquaticus]OYD56884.1 transcriptional regulator [Fictibacillus aquaticus]
MRADRLMNILILLQNRGKITTGELAEELEVSERTIQRDMDALTTAGVPVLAERGKAGGWRLYDDFKTKLSGLNKEDIRSLFIFPSKTLLEDLGLGTGLDTREKLLSSLAGPYQEEAQHIRDRIYIDSEGWKENGHKKDEALPEIFTAVFENRRIKIEYEKINGDIINRTVEPLGLVAQKGNWYLAASHDGQLRSYRVSRVLTAHLLDEVFERPDGFHLEEYWRQSKKDFAAELPTFEVEVDISADIAKRVHFSAGKFMKVVRPPLKKGERMRAVFHFQSEQEAVEFILGFGTKMTIIKPKKLIKKIVAEAVSVISYYED